MGLPCPVEEAPWLKAPKRESQPWIGHLADTLAALGWSDPGHLQEAVGRWREVLIDHAPDLLAMESAPTALLASFGMPMRRVWLANHWSTPPRVSPLPDINSRITGLARPVPDTEPAVVESINGCLADQDQPPIANLYELFDRADDSMMLSISEIDPHSPRSDTEYLGVWWYRSGYSPPWPSCDHGPDTPGIFAYLKPYPHRLATLRLLAETGLPVLAYAPNMNRLENGYFYGENLCLVDKPIDWLNKRETTAFVVCSGADSVAQAIQCGIPVLVLPMSLEQLAVAQQASQSGSAVLADFRDIQSISHGVQKMLLDESITTEAERLGEKYASYNPDEASKQLADRMIIMPA